MFLSRWSVTAVVAPDEGRDPARRFIKPVLGFVGEDKANVLIAKIVGTPGIHGRDGDVLFAEKSPAELAGAHAQGRDVGDEEVAAIRRDQPYPRNRLQAADREPTS